MLGCQKCGRFLGALNIGGGHIGIFEWGLQETDRILNNLPCVNSELAKAALNPKPALEDQQLPLA